MSAVKPFPEEISQDETQLVLYESNAYFSSPYKTLEQVFLHNFFFKNKFLFNSLLIPCWNHLPFFPFFFLFSLFPFFPSSLPPCACLNHLQLQTTTIKLPGKVENHHGPQPFELKDNTFKLGSYLEVQPHTEQNFRVHYIFNAPFPILRRVEKEIEISHWGNIAVEENVILENAGNWIFQMIVEFLCISLIPRSCFSPIFHL